VMSFPLTSNSPRKHTEFRQYEFFRVIPCASVAVYQDQGLIMYH
jgi:hypothetical protein